MSVTVAFESVGAGKVSWKATAKELTYKWLYKEVKSIGMVMSRDLDFPYDEETNTGAVVAGFRIIGKFHVVKDAAQVQ